LFVAAPLPLHGLQSGPHDHRVGIANTAELGHRRATTLAAAEIGPVTWMDRPGETVATEAEATTAAAAAGTSWKRGGRTKSAGSHDLYLSPSASGECVFKPEESKHISVRGPSNRK